MLKKEVKEVIKQFLVFLVIVVSLAVIIRLTSSLLDSDISFGEVFFFVFQLGLVIFSVFMGTSLFSQDRGDGGMEYLLTLPYSRLQLLFIKLLPRFISVLAATVLYWFLLFATGTNPNHTMFMPLLPMGILGLLYLSLFILSVSFSIVGGSIVVAGLTAMFSFLVYFGIVHLFFPAALVLKGREVFFHLTLFEDSQSVPGHLYFSTIALLLASFIAFVYAFKRLHLGSSREMIRRYLKVFIPIFIIVVLVSVFWAVGEVEEPRNMYFLTGSRQLIENQYYSTRIYNSTGVKQIDEAGYYWGYHTIEKGGYVYTFYQSRYATQLARMNLRDPNYSVEVVYNVKGRAYVKDLSMYKDDCMFIERLKNDNLKTYYLVVVNPDTGTFRKMMVNKAGHVEIYPFLFGAGEIEGKRFWLVYYGFYQEWEVKRIWEDGRIDGLGTTGIRPAFEQGILITANSGSIIFSKFTPAGVEEIKRIPGIRGLSFYQGRLRHLEQHPARELYGGVRGRESYQWEKVLKLNLETLELAEVKALENSTGYFRYSSPDNWYYISLNFNDKNISYVEIKLYRLKQGNVEALEKLAPFIINREDDYFDIYDTGMVIRKDGKISIYTLPGWEEIKFKELN